MRVIFVFDSMRALPFLSATSTIETIRSRIREVSLLEGAFLPSARARHVRVVVVWSPHARAFGVNYFVTRSRATKKERKKGKKNLALPFSKEKKGSFLCVCVLVNRERKKTRLFGASFIDATEARARATQTDTERERERERLKRKNEGRRRRRRRRREDGEETREDNDSNNGPRRGRRYGRRRIGNGFL